MYLRTLIPVNWGTLQPVPFEFKGTTLLTGASGAGKSMILDAMQAVFTAAHSKVARFNIAQSESGDKRSRDKFYRTLEGYALGQLSQTFQRKTANTWVAGVFAPSGSEMARPFSAVIGVTATLEREQAVLNRLALLLIQGEVSLDDLTILDERGQRVARPLADAGGYFQDRFGATRVLSFSDSKGEYLQSLYGWCEGRKYVSPAEALQSARAIVRACAYRPVESVNDLIRGEILEEVDMKDVVDQIASIMRDIRGLKEEGQRLGRSLEALEAIAAATEKARTAYFGIRRANLAHTIQRVLANERALEAAREEHRTQNKLAAGVVVEREALEVSRRGLDEQLRAVTTQLEQIPAAAQEKILKAALEQGQAGAHEHGEALRQALRVLAVRPAQIEQVLGALKSFDSLTPSVERARARAKRLPGGLIERLVKEVEHRLKTEEPLADLRQSLEQVAVADAALIDELKRPDGGLATRVLEHQFGMRQELLRHEYDVRDLRRRISAMDAGQFDMPPTVRAALELIRRELPKEAHPSIVAEHVEPRPGSFWIEAIEGYIGNNRYAILVEPAFEVAAMRLLRDPREVRGGPQPKVLQVSRLQSEGRGTIVEGSILEELEFRKPVVRNYLTALYGNVVKVEELEHLKHTARGITLSGHAAGNYAVSRFSPVDPADRAFGVSGRERALAALKSKLQEEESATSELAAGAELIKGLAEAFVKLDVTDPVPAFNKRVLAEEICTAVHRSLAVLDLTDAEELRSQEAALLGQIDALRIKAQEVDRKVGEIGNTVKTLETRIAQCESQIPERKAAVEQAKSAVVAMATEDASIDVAEFEREALAQAQAAPTSGTDSPERRALAAVGDLQGAMADLRATLRDYNRAARAQESIRHELVERAEEADRPATHQQLNAIKRQCADQLRAQREHALAGIKDELETAEEQFNSVFTSVFAHQMRNAIDEGVRALALLNARIERFRFGHDAYRITWHMLPQYETYAAFFRHVSERGEDLIKGQTIFALPMAPELARVRDELKTLLLSDDANAADRRLKEIMDWRNYRKYDIAVTRTDTGSVTPLSTFGTGSGGETQTPFYVVRASVLAAALRHDNGSPTHLSVLLLDEAFSAMDGERSRKVMDLLRGTFGLQVICAMPTKNCGAVRGLFEREYQSAMLKAAGTASGRVTVSTQVDLKREAISALIERARQEIVSEVYAEHGLPVPEPEPTAPIEPLPDVALREREAVPESGF